MPCELSIFTYIFFNFHEACNIITVRYMILFELLKGSWYPRGVLTSRLMWGCALGPLQSAAFGSKRLTHTVWYGTVRSPNTSLVKSSLSCESKHGKTLKVTSISHISRHKRLCGFWVDQRHIVELLELFSSCTWSKVICNEAKLLIFVVT